MSARGLVFTSILSTLGAAVASPQGVAIDHKQVGCIVVGKYPKMNACFTPASGVARGRVYFRPEGNPTWYYVEMKSDQPCYAGVLPRPGKKLVGKTIAYYVEAQDKTFNAARTEEYGPVVVRSAQECKKQLPVAPFLNSANVAVFPSLPAGFAGGGLGTGAVLGIVGAGAAAAGTAAIVASNNNNETTLTTVAITTPTSVTTPVTLPSPSPSPSSPPKTNHNPIAVLATKPDPPQGLSPLTVIFDMCKSSDPDGDPLTFYFNFGDGAKTSGSSCVESHTYLAPLRAAWDVKAKDASFTFEGSAVDPSLGSGSRSRTVSVQTPTPPPPVCGTPSVAFGARPGSCGVGTPVTVDIIASDPSGISTVMSRGTYDGDYVGGVCVPRAKGTTEDTQTATGIAPNFTATLRLVPPTGTPKCYTLDAGAINGCGNSALTSMSFILANYSCSPIYVRARDVIGGLMWASDLKVEGGRLQVVINGAAITYPPGGVSYGTAALKPGENRVEATLVEGNGKAGLWTFDSMGTQAVASDSFRVVAGELVEIAGTSITFRLHGTPGERVAFTFLKQ